MKSIFIMLLLLVVISQSSAQSAEKVTPAFGLSDKETTLQRGKAKYEMYCSGCHGLKGDGQGPAANFLDPKPRNFVEAQYKFTSGVSGTLPTDADLMRVITDGLHGTSMPSWKLVSEVDRHAIVSYIKTFAGDRFASEASTSSPTVIAEDPFLQSGSKEEAIARGEKAYHGLAACYSCHAAYIAPDKINEARVSYQMDAQSEYRAHLGEPVATQTESGQTILPPDFTWNQIKSGSDLTNLYRIIANGINGTAMPSWKGVLAEEDLWGMAYYVNSLAEKRPKIVTEAALTERKLKLADFESQRIAFEEQMKLEASKKAAEAAQKTEAVVESVTP